jgi:multimeric flavodoxin WrbA
MGARMRLCKYAMLAFAPVLQVTAFVSTRVLVLWHSETGRTELLGSLVAKGASAQGAMVRLRSVAEVNCTDLRWMDGLALGSPVYWGAMSGQMKTFIDTLQTRCFGYPVHQLAWRAGAAFTTGAHESTGKEAVLASFHAFFMAVQMVPTGSALQSALSQLGACATNRNETAPKPPKFNTQEEMDAIGLGSRLAQLAAQLRGLRDVRTV